MLFFAAKSIFRIVFHAAIILLLCHNSFARGYATEENFFTYKRFVLNAKVVDRIPQRSRARHEVSLFVEEFSKGLDAIFAGRTDEAKKNLSRARKIWPEYFDTDFVLALLYEDSGEPKKAARYYKSYLNKLKRFHSGLYRISEPLIRGLASSDIADYEEARDLVEKHLRPYGIRLSRVRPVITPPVFVFPMLLLTALGVAYVTTVYWLLPYLKKMERVKNPPEGFWVCRKCGTANTKLNKVCETCGRPYE